MLFLVHFLFYSKVQSGAGRFGAQHVAIGFKLESMDLNRF